MKSCLSSPLHPLRNQRGAMLIVVLVAVVVMGLGAALAGTSWKTITQRAREQQLLWVGQQYQRAIESYYNADFRGGSQPRAFQPPGREKTSSGTGMLPSRLEDLVRDPRSAGVVRHLRSIYPDPMTGEPFVLIKDQGGRIRGVRSSSDEKPFQTDNFPAGLEAFSGAERYSQWDFIYETPQNAVQPGGVNFDTGSIPGSGSSLPGTNPRGDDTPGPARE
ncbi:type II secretion system protein [Geoalkalibacter subterraneus]|uniref:type II secretion system protein n=1 Tax=Geoalkalibacter subterraneus TaxID=483547 RepID=UPI000693EB93|nr:type II secretion system protein [Geoalkalibacter subterraneus]